jgi:hypothetical protein
LKGENKYYLSTAIDEVDIDATIGAWSEAIEMMGTS